MGDIGNAIANLVTALVVVSLIGTISSLVLAGIFVSWWIPGSLGIVLGLLCICGIFVEVGDWRRRRKYRTD